jgi:hypothetical protein
MTGLESPRKQSSRTVRNTWTRVGRPCMMDTMRDTDTEATGTREVFVVERMKSGAHVSRGKEVARFESAIAAAKDAERRDEGREWNDDWHRSVRKEV